MIQLNQVLNPIVEPLNGQYSDFASLLSDTPKVDAPFVELVQMNGAIAYQRKHNGEIVCTYAGFSNKAKAKQYSSPLAEAILFQVGGNLHK